MNRNSTDPGNETRRQLNEAHLAAARANFQPLEELFRLLNEVAVEGHGRAYEVERESEMRSVAHGTCDVVYAVRHPSEKRLLIRFTMVGENADRILFQVQQRSSDGNEETGAGAVDPHVYRLGEMDELKKVVRNRIVVFLAKQGR